jgi:hypothetical protein
MIHLHRPLPIRIPFGVMLAAWVGVSMGACDRSPVGPASCCPPIRAITLADWTRDGYGTPAATDAIASIAAAGANTIVLVVTAYQSDVHAAALDRDDPRTASRVAVLRAAQAVQDAGLEVVFKPHVDVDDGTWRGHIAPADPGAWFGSYRDFVLPWAALAESLGSVLFVVGTELASTLDEERYWRETLAAVRGKFSGQLVYAASWDECDRVPFWDALDLVGVDAYFPIASRPDPGRFELLAGWQPWIERLELLQHRAGRPILLTEIGYRSVDGAGERPYDIGAAGRIDLLEQSDLYWAALQATALADGFAGLCWWNWRAAGGGGPLDSDYTPAGKLAEQELRSAWGTR